MRRDYLSLQARMNLRLRWLDSTHCLSERHWDYLAVTHILEKNLRIAYNQRVGYI